MKLKWVLRWFAAIAVMFLVACLTKSAHALPGFSPGEGYVTSGAIGGIGNTTGCNGCHGPATAPSTVSMQVNGGGFLSIAGVTRNFTVPKNTNNHFQVHVSPPAAGQPAAGFLVFHTDGTTNDAGGMLHTTSGAQHTCKSPGTDGVAGCGTTGNNNTEVMHAGGAVSGGGGTITLDFQYDSLNNCSVHSFRIWINSVNFNGFCDGAGDAAAFFDFTVSNTGACSDGNACTTGEVCQTNGTCGGGGAVTCTPSDSCHSVGACNPGSGCPAETINVGIPCDDGNACTNGTTCQAGTGACGGGTPVTCATPDQCHSQGACNPASGCPAQVTLTGAGCNDGNACTGPDTCQANGTCTGTTNACPAPDQCHDPVVCSTVSGCPPLPSKSDGTQCGAASFCVGNVFHPHQACATGACTSPGTTVCNGTCDPITGCGGCNSDADCLAGNYCDNTGTCVLWKPSGTCNIASGAAGGDCKSAGCHECATNNCVDGFCCNSACAGGSTTDCVACNVGGLQGTCSPIAVGTGCNADSNLCTQNDACNAGGTCVPGASVVCAAPQACQAAGVCNGGTGTCTFALLNGTTCTAAACQPDGITLLQRSLCTGASPTCPAQVPLNCFPNPCSGGACATGCTADPNCAAGAYCDGAACQGKKPNGTTCGGDHECQQGHCADGVCCSAACNGQCEACDVGGSVGTCLTISGVPHGTRPQCMNDGTGCGGTCDGVQAMGCTYPDSVKGCRAASCNAATNVGTLPAGCNSAGACPAIQTLSCGNFICNAALTQCNGDCMGDDTKCTATSYCAAGICQPKKKNGDTCGLPHECETNFCTDGVCCSADCKGQCQACDLAGSAGTCTTVPSGPPHGGRLRCDGAGACTASCNGGSATACGFPDATQLCSPPSCAAGTEVQIATCNGAGACSTPVQKDCTPYACGVTSCRTACASPLDCARGFDCIAAACISADAATQQVEASTPDGGTDGSVEPPDASVVSADAATADAATADVSATDANVATPDAGTPGAVDAAGLPVAPEFEGGSCACRAAGESTPNPVAVLLPLLGLVLTVARRRAASGRRRPRV